MSVINLNSGLKTTGEKKEVEFDAVTLSGKITTGTFTSPTTIETDYYVWVVTTTGGGYAQSFNGDVLYKDGVTSIYGNKGSDPRSVVVTNPGYAPTSHIVAYCARFNNAKGVRQVVTNENRLSTAYWKAPNVKAKEGSRLLCASRPDGSFSNSGTIAADPEFLNPYNYVVGYSTIGSWWTYLSTGQVGPTSGNTDVYGFTTNINCKKWNFTIEIEPF